MSKLTINQLLEYRKELYPNIKPFNAIKLVDTVVRYDNNTLRVNSEAKSTTSSSNHKQSIIFYNVKYYDRVLKTGLPVKDANGEYKYMGKINANTHKCEVKCSCESYRFAFEWYAAKAGSNIGRARGYKRKTPPPPEGRPYVNPNFTPGLCKHLIGLIETLKKRGVIISFKDQAKDKVIKPQDFKSMSYDDIKKKYGG